MNSESNPANQPTRERGTIASWTDAHGHGRIKADNGDVLYTTFTSVLLEQSPQPRVGQPVEFSRFRHRGDLRLFAVGVVVLDSKGRPSITVSDDVASNGNKH